ncbi:MAG TPA: peptide chain release factor-like protein [Candidatus Acidoferrum sp.]|nr:peptide chain release factor-like protein [Candidatus Acidoferrum sp.]
MELNLKDLVVTVYQTHRLLSDAEGVQILHRPSGAMVKCDTEETTEENRQQAMLMLTTKVEIIKAQAQARLHELEALRHRFSDLRSMSELTGQAQNKVKELSDFDIDAIADKVIKPNAGERISYAQARKFARAILAAAKD